MLAASMCREVHFTVLPSTLASSVPRCLFGPPNSKDTVELLQEALDMERSRFARRWGVDPREEDKENNDSSGGLQQIQKRKIGEKSPRKRHAPYARQSNIHDFWRPRKSYDGIGKKAISSTVSSNEATKQQITENLQRS
ncbi:uncharacterized protein LOC112695056 [Athalia rosae]|uniref:uncharacterized protein LOC112695056 n=1 Tax=Athalia rosae TaxID=37344 RepID=UPI0006264C7D|nr:uncharacterized protein LOC112695056 [Athalia rosae]